MYRLEEIADSICKRFVVPDMSMAQTIPVAWIIPENIFLG
jgi:hypothetical protein